MRIAILSTFYPFRGGIAQFNGALYNELEKNHEVKAFNFSTQYPSILFPGKTQYVDENDGAYKIDSVRCLSSVNPQSYQKTVKLISEYKPDLLIIGYWMPFMAPSLGYVAKKMCLKTKVIAIVHNAIPHEVSKIDKSLNNYFFNRVEQVITLSQSVKNDILRLYPKQKITVLHHPVYEHFGEKIEKGLARYELGLESDKKYLLFFGLIRAYKGVDVAIKALSHLPEDYHLLIVGEAYESLEKYEQIIKELGLEKRVKIINEYVPDERVKDFFSAADACVLPYKSATQSGIIAIAQHFKTPVFASDVGGLGEFIENGKTGYLIESGNDQLFASSIHDFFQSNQQESFSKNLEANQKKLTWSHFVDELILYAKSENTTN
jgi:glycosyltransferase involved in cell wall biosynthesis